MVYAYWDEKMSYDQAWLSSLNNCSFTSEAMQKYHCNVLLKNILYIISQTRSGIPVYSFLSLLTLHSRGEFACYD